MVGSKGIRAELHLYGKTDLGPLYSLCVHIRKEMLAAIQLRELKFHGTDFRMEDFSARGNLQAEEVVLGMAGEKLERCGAFCAPQECLRVILCVWAGGNHQHLG